MNKLDLFYDKIIKADVFLKVENTSEKENKVFNLSDELIFQEDLPQIGTFKAYANKVVVARF